MTLNDVQHMNAHVHQKNHISIINLHVIEHINRMLSLLLLWLQNANISYFFFYTLLELVLEWTSITFTRVFEVFKQKINMKHQQVKVDYWEMVRT